MIVSSRETGKAKKIVVTVQIVCCVRPSDGTEEQAGRHPPKRLRACVRACAEYRI